MSKFEFKSEDFDLIRMWECHEENISDKEKAELATSLINFYHREKCAELANAKLQQWLSEAPVVYKTSVGEIDGVWLDDDWEAPGQFIRKARLVEIEEIK